MEDSDRYNPSEVLILFCRR